MEGFSPYLIIFPLALAMGCVAVCVFAVRSEIRLKNQASRHFLLTIAAIVITLVFYPMTVAPIGPASNGGLLGLGALIVAEIGRAHV